MSNKLELGAKDYRVEFDDSLLSLRGHFNSRINGSKIISPDFNRSGSDDLGRDLPGRLDYAAEKSTVNLYFGTTIIDGEEEAELQGLVRFEQHSYIKIDKIFECDPYRGTVRVIQIGVDDSGLPFSPAISNVSLQTKDLISTTKKGFSRIITDDFERRGEFNIKILDKKVDKKLKNNYICKFNQGYFMRIAKYYPSGSSPSNDGVRLIYSSELGNVFGLADAVNNTTPQPPVGRSFWYANGAGTTNIGENNFQLNDPLPVEISHYTGSKVFDTAEVPFGSLSGSAHNKNIRQFYARFINPQTFNRSIRTFVTFESGGLGNVLTIDQTGMESLGTVELRGLSGEQYKTITDDFNNSVFPGIPTVGRDRFVRTTIEASGSKSHILTSFNFISDDGIDSLGNVGVSTTSQTADIKMSGSYYFPHSSYQLSCLREDIVLIADLDKETELPDGVGDEGFVLVPKDLHKNIKSNLEFYMARCGLIPNNKFIEYPDFLQATKDRISIDRE